MIRNAIVIFVTLISFVFTSIVFAAVTTPQTNKLPTLTLKRENFIEFMLPKINRANQKIMRKRERLILMHKFWQADGHIVTAGELQWLQQLSKYYRLKHPSFLTNATWRHLINRVDGIPASLVIAQAINESAWGRSYFAKKGNNYFGVWCTVSGCGIVPRQRPQGATYEVKKYVNALASVEDYMRNINTHGSYRELRKIRSQLRYEEQLITGLDLSAGLKHYSQRGMRYVESLRLIIKSYNLDRYDRVYPLY